MAITILGFDPGLKVTGWGVIEKEGSNLTFLACGEIELSGALSFREVLSTEVRRIVENLTPDACAVEDFVAYPGSRKRPRRVPAVQDILMGNVMGIITNTICTVGLRPNMAIAPAWEIKKAVTGQRNATKSQVREMVRRLLNIERWKSITGNRKKISSHCADALAAAIWYAHSLDVNKIIEVMSSNRQVDKTNGSRPES